jgi:hypothetical protein
VILARASERWWKSFANEHRFVKPAAVKGCSEGARLAESAHPLVGKRSGTRLFGRAAVEPI